MNVLNLFKYYAPKYKGKDNLSFYSQGSIYFQKPIKFNDPWDCKAPQIKCPRQLKLLKDIWFNLAKNKIDPALVKTEWQKLRKELTRTEITQLLVKRFKEAFEGLRSKIGVFSLSFIPDCELMWSHYASSHSGYMLHFQIDIAQYCANSSLNNVVTLHPVKYRDKREVWDLANYVTSTNKCKSQELTRRVSCVKGYLKNPVNGKRGAHGILYTTNPGRKVSYFSTM